MTDKKPAPAKEEVERPKISHSNANNELHEFLGKIKFMNTLPPVPGMDAKFLTIPVDPSRYASYKATKLEKTMKNDLSNSMKESVHIPLADFSTYPTTEQAIDNWHKSMIPAESSLHPDDLYILGLGAGTELASIENKRDIVLSTIGTDFTIKKRQGAGAFSFKTPARNATKLLQSIANSKKDMNNVMTQESAQRVIESTFEACRDLSTLRHPTKPELSVKRTLPVLPARQPFTEELSMFIFDASPQESEEKDGGLCLFSTPSLLSNFNISSDSSLIYYYKAEDHPVDGLAIDENNGIHQYSYERTYNFMKKQEDKQSYIFKMMKDRVIYHPIAHKVVLKAHRSSRGLSAVSRSDKAPQHIKIHRQNNLV